MCVDSTCYLSVSCDPFLTIFSLQVMDFARKQLEKMGWKPGRGLGKDENGIQKPIRPGHQRDTAGLGFDRTSTFNTQVWFAKIDSAIMTSRREKKLAVKKTKRRKIEKDDEKVLIPVEDGEPADTSLTVDQTESSGRNKFYTSFTKPEVLKTGIDLKPEPEEVPQSRTRKRKSKTSLDLDRVFAASGATCHRSAHTGVRMSGKMRRLMQQEEIEKMSKSIKNEN